MNSRERDGWTGMIIKHGYSCSDCMIGNHIHKPRFPPQVYCKLTNQNKCNQQWHWMGTGCLNQFLNTFDETVLLIAHGGTMHKGKEPRWEQVYWLRIKENHRFPLNAVFFLHLWCIVLSSCSTMNFSCYDCGRIIIMIAILWALKEALTSSLWRTKIKAEC